MSKKNKTQFLAYKEFLPSLKALMQKGGLYQKAAKTVQAAWGLANTDDQCSHEEVFSGISLTNHGETRIAHCIKYDLTKFARLVTAYSNDVCIFLFTGDHDTVDAWLERNKGLDFIARESGGSVRVSPVFISDTSAGKNGLIKSEIDFMSNGPIINILGSRYKDKLLTSLDADTVSDINTIESHSDEEAILEVVTRVKDDALSKALLDVLLELRAGDEIKAKNRIDLYEKSAKPVAELTESETAKIVSSDNTVRVQDVDPVLFEHFIKTANFKDWMLYLHPAQREIVDREFQGPTRLSGVSGSGKTCVVIHRGLKLARQNPERRVLVLTLNDALATLIDVLIDAESGTARPKNLTIKSVFQLCREKLIQLNPKKAKYYSKQTIAANGFSTPEHIDEIWEEYFHCQNNNFDADEMFDVQRTLLVRNVFPKDYIRQEFDYIRSAFAPKERDQYLAMERTGRTIPLTQKFRESILSGLNGWERKMSAVGAIDDNGIVTELYGYLDKIAEEFDHVLVDEVQDLGTLELRIIRKITKVGKNDLFLCGDSAQTVHTKYSDYKAAGIDLPSARWIKLEQNYRNSRQILFAAHTVLTRSFEQIPEGTTDIEIIRPEFANFSSSNPLLLEGKSIRDEVSMALAFANEYIEESQTKKACLAFCGYSQASMDVIGRELDLPVLCGATVLSEGSIFLSDLEQTKGFEFDLMIVINCSAHVIPHPELPEQESFRELCKLYVALTRAKTDLIVSFNKAPSLFVQRAKEECFNVGSWNEHVVTPVDISRMHWPAPSLKRMGNKNNLAVTGREFLRRREAVGLSMQVQQELIDHVTGTPKTQGRAGASSRKIEWKDFLSFFEDMAKPRVRGTLVSDEAWSELLGHLEPIFSSFDPDDKDSDEHISAERAEVSLPKPTVQILGTQAKKAAAEIGKITLHRREDILSFSINDMSAHIVASLMVLQQKPSLDSLEIGEPISRTALEFLVPRRELTEWLVKRRLREVNNRNSSVALTKAGFDECQLRVVKPDDKNRPANTSKATTLKRVMEFRELILTGDDNRKDDKKFVRRPFDIRNGLIS